MTSWKFFSRSLSLGQAIKSVIGFKVIVNVDVMSGKRPKAKIGFEAAIAPGVDLKS